MRRFTSASRRGQSLVEYVLILALVAVVVVGALRLLGVNIGSAFCKTVQGVGVQASGICSAGGQFIFNDDFGGGLGNWRLDRGKNWREANGQLCAGPGGEHRAFANNSSGGDYTVSVNANLSSGPGYGVFFRASGTRLNGYTFQYDASSGGGQFIIRKWVNGYQISPPIATSRPPKGFQWRDTARQIEVVAKGNTFEAYVDGQKVVTGMDNTYSTGGAGLRTWSGSQTCFDNFQVKLP